MAYIPELRGVVYDIRKLDEHYYKSEIVLKDVEPGHFSPSWPDVVHIKFKRPVEDLPFGKGQQVHAIAFQIGREDQFEAEGFKVVGETDGEDMIVQPRDKTMKLVITKDLFPVTPPVSVKPGEKDSEIRKRTAIEQFLTRCRNSKQVEKIDNDQLMAGEPMVYYCIYCGAISDILAEDFLCGPRYECSCCEHLRKEGWHKEAFEARKLAEL